VDDDGGEEGLDDCHYCYYDVIEMMRIIWVIVIMWILILIWMS
jgi:hypothetical protein